MSIQSHNYHMFIHLCTYLYIHSSSYDSEGMVVEDQEHLKSIV